MSFWSHLGSVASSVVDDVGNGIGTAWNLAKVTHIPQAIQSGLNGLQSAATFASRTAGDMAQVADQVAMHGSLGNENQLYNRLQSRKLTVGQALTAGIGGSGDMNKDFDTIKQRATAGPWYDFSNPNRDLSGAIDLYLNWKAAPDILGLKGVGAARDATRVLRPGDLEAIKGAQEAGTTPNNLLQVVTGKGTEGLDLRQRAQASTLNGLLQATDDKSMTQLMQMRAFRDTPGADSLAALLVDANKVADPVDRLATKQTIWRAALGSQADIDSLRSMSPAAYHDLLNARAGLDGQTAELHLAQLTGLDKNGARVSPEAMAQWQQDLADKTAEFNDRYKEAIDQEIRVNQVTRSFDGQIPKVNGLLDKSRMGIVQGRNSVFQDGLFSTPLNVWHMGATLVQGSRPTGVVNLHDAGDVIRNLTAQIQRTRRVSPEQAQQWIDRVVQANTDSDRFHALQAVEDDIFRHVGQQALGKDVSTEDLNQIIRDYRSQHKLARSKFFGMPEQAYTAAKGPDGRYLDYFTDESGNWHTRPVLDTQLGNAYPIIDTDYVYNTLKRSQSTFRAYAGMGKDAVAGLANMGITPWKMLKLVRLGYPVRMMAGDNFIRMITVMGAYPLLREAMGEAGEAFLHNHGLFTGAQKAAYDLRSSLLLERNEIDHDLVMGGAPAGQKLYRRDISNAEMNPEKKPQGLYTSIERPGFVSPFAGQSLGGVDVGDTDFHFRAKVDLNGPEVLHPAPYDIDMTNLRKGMRGMIVPADAGVSALRHIEGEDRFNEIVTEARRGKESFAKYLAKQPGGKMVHWDRYYDPYEMLMAYGGIVARKQGYKGIMHTHIFNGQTDSDLDEFVALTEDAIHSPDEKYNSLLARRQEIEDKLAATPMPLEGKEHLGRGTITHRGYTLPDAAGTSENDWETYSAMLDPRASFEQTLGIHANNVRKRMAQAYDYKRIMGSDGAEYGNAWEKAVNYQLKQSPLVQAILDKGESGARSWLKNTPEGREVVHRMYPVYHGDTADMVDRASGMLDQTLGGSQNLRAALQERNLTFKDLQDEFGHQPGNYPAIHAPSIDATLHQGPAANLYNAALEGWFKVVSDIPERVLARHPTTVLLYRQHVKDMLDRAIAGSEDGSVAVEDLNDIRNKALGLARRDMKRMLYDVTATPNLGAGVFRYLFPFYGAYRDVMTKYGRILLDNPEFAARFQQIWDAPNSMGMVVDQNGNKVPPGHGLEQGDFIVLPFIGGSDGMDKVRLSKSSFDVILQGDPFWIPGWGPLATYPANVITLTHPVLGDTFKRLGILPFGASINSTDEANPLPNWMITAARSGIAQEELKGIPGVGPDLAKMADTLIKAVPGLGDSKEYDNTFAQLAAVKAIDYNRTGKGAKPGSSKFFDDVAHTTSVTIATKALMQGVLPTSQSLVNKYQFYFDQAHNYEDPTWQKQHPEVFTRFDPIAGATIHYTPAQAFYADYPNYFEAMISQSQSNVGGIKPTVQGFEASKKWAKEIAQYPDYGALFVGPADDGTFSPSAYAAQFNTPVGPGTSQTQRSVKDPKKAVNDIEVQKGWTRYMSAMNTLDVALHKQGFQSYSDSGAENLKAAKQAYVQYLMQDDPQWASEFQKHDESRFPTFLHAAQLAVSSPNAKGRGDLAALGLYLDARKVFQQVLAQRKAQGGSSSIDSASNQDVRNAFDAYGQYLKQKYVTFGDIYDRYLGQTERGSERDNLTVVTK